MEKAPVLIARETVIDATQRSMKTGELTSALNTKLEWFNESTNPTH